MTPHERRTRSRMLISLLVVAIGIVVGAGGVALLSRFSPAAPQRPAVRPAAQDGPRPLSEAAIRARIGPSVVDVTATLTYDDETASGTGFVIDARGGLILTNNHVIRDATAVGVMVPATGRAYRADIVGVDVTADIAVLRIRPAAALTAAPIGDSATAIAGAPVTSFGNQAGAGGSPTVTSGVIAGTSRTIQADDGAAGFSETLHGMLATTARIEPGDSGGPLAGAAGTVIGVDTAAGTGGGGIGYAIPIDAAMAAERKITGRHPGHGISLGGGGFLGVIVGPGGDRSPAAQRSGKRGGTTSVSVPSGCVPAQADVTAPAAIAPAPAGALVLGVLCGTSAATAGIVAGDVITGAGGHQVGSPDALTAIQGASPPGTVIPVTWVSTSGSTRTARIRLSPAPAA